MAAWLAYLKSRLLLPSPDPEEPSGEELAAALAFQLQRLEAMREAGAKLMGRPRLGIEVFARGMPEGVRVVARSVYETSLYDLIAAYAAHCRRQENATLQIVPTDLFSLEEALERLGRMIGRARAWTALGQFLPPVPGGGLRARSALAATFLAGLELTKAGRAELRQERAFEPVYIRASRRRPHADGDDARPHTADSEGQGDEP